MLSYILFFAWLIFLSWCLTKIKFVKKSGLANKIIIGLFVCKVAAGLIGGKITHSSHIMLDTWIYHREALIQYDLLFSNPKVYVTDLFVSPYDNNTYTGIFKAGDSFWNDLKLNAIVKFISVLCVFSFGNYYVNVVLYNFIIFFGFISLFRFFKKVFKPNDVVNTIVVFLIPSCLYYSSAIHKEGLVLSALGFLLYLLYKFVWRTSFSVKAFLVFLLSLLIIFIFRIYILIAFVPAFAALFISAKYKKKTGLIFLIVYFIGIATVFLMPKIIPSINFPELIAAKQNDFAKLGFANTKITAPDVEPTFFSFAKNAPLAFLNGFLRPLVTDYKLSTLLLPFAFELLFFELIIIAFFFFKLPSNKINQPFFYFCVLFIVTLCLLTGYTTTILGAIVRYKSVYLPFIIAPFLFYTDWSQLAIRLKIIK